MSIILEAISAARNFVSKYSKDNSADEAKRLKKYKMVGAGAAAGGGLASQFLTKTGRTQLSSTAKYMGKGKTALALGAGTAMQAGVGALGGKLAYKVKRKIERRRNVR